MWEGASVLLTELGPWRPWRVLREVFMLEKLRCPTALVKFPFCAALAMLTILFVVNALILILRLILHLAVLLACSLTMR